MHTRFDDKSEFVDLEYVVVYLNVDLRFILSCSAAE